MRTYSADGTSVDNSGKQSDDVIGCVHWRATDRCASDLMISMSSRFEN